MAKSNSKSRRISEIIIIVVIFLSVALIVVEMSNNLASEFVTQEATTTVREVEPTPVPTLTAEERQELFSAPVGEDGNE